MTAKDKHEEGREERNKRPVSQSVCLSAHLCVCLQKREKSGSILTLKINKLRGSERKKRSGKKVFAGLDGKDRWIDPFERKNYRASSECDNDKANSTDAAIKHGKRERAELALMEQQPQRKAGFQQHNLLSQSIHYYFLLVDRAGYECVCLMHYGIVNSIYLCFLSAIENKYTASMLSAEFEIDISNCQFETIRKESLQPSPGNQLKHKKRAQLRTHTQANNNNNST